jgi:hypothetical protein
MRQLDEMLALLRSIEERLQRIEEALVPPMVRVDLSGEATLAPELRSDSMGAPRARPQWR